MSRRTARKQAFLNLYQSDVNDCPLGPTLERWREYRGDLQEYAVSLARGVEQEQEQLDALALGSLGGVAGAPHERG